MYMHNEVACVQQYIQTLNFLGSEFVLYNSQLLTLCNALPLPLFSVPITITITL